MAVTVLNGLEDDIVEQAGVSDMLPPEEGDTAKPKRKPFHVWTVGGKDYRLKLKSDMIIKLETQYKAPIFDIISDMPPLSTQLTIIQAALKKYEHGLGFESVKQLYDKWVDEEYKSPIDLYKEVVLPTLVVSGFFPRENEEDIMMSLTGK